MILRSVTYVRQFNKRLWVLSIGWFVSALGFAVSIPFIAIYFHSDLGLSLSQIGLFFGAMAVIRSLFQIVGGEISDHIPRQSLLIYSQMIRAAAFLFLAIAIFHRWGFVPVAAGLLLNSIFGAVFQPVANAMVSDIVPPDKRLDGYAITRSAGNLGWAVGPAIGGFMAGYSYGLLFVISSLITLISGFIFLIFFQAPPRTSSPERFRLSDIIAVKNDPYLAWHAALIFLLYLVHSQLIAPFSVYSVDMVKISEHQLGLLYTLNGLMVVALQLPITKVLSATRLTSQLTLGAFTYSVGYTLVGLSAGFEAFAVAVMVVTLGEIFMSPAALALTSRLAPEGKMGRYMGVFGFFVASGWSFGPLYGGLLLDHFGYHPALAWMLISLLAVVSGIGYIVFSGKLPDKFNKKN